MKIRTLAAAALATALSACSAEFAPISIYALCTPPVPTAEGCVYPATCDSTLAGTPVLDVTTALLDFRLPVQIDNTLADNSSTVDGRINTNNATIQSWEVTYSGAAVAPWNVNTSVRIPTTGNASALLRLIPQTYFSALVPPGSGTLSIVVNVRGHGVLDSQDAFTTAWFKVPVEICAGCLAGTLSCAAGSVLRTCPSMDPTATSPGQTAVAACIAQ